MVKQKLKYNYVAGADSLYWADIGDAQGIACRDCVARKEITVFSWSSDMKRRVSSEVGYYYVKSHLLGCRHNSQVLGKQYWKDAWTRLKNRNLIPNHKRCNLEDLKNHLRDEDKLKLKQQLSDIPCLFVFVFIKVSFCIDCCQRTIKDNNFIRKTINCGIILSNLTTHGNDHF